MNAKLHERLVYARLNAGSLSDGVWYHATIRKEFDAIADIVEIDNDTLENKGAPSRIIVGDLLEFYTLYDINMREIPLV